MDRACLVSGAGCVGTLLLKGSKSSAPKSNGVDCECIPAAGGV